MASTSSHSSCKNNQRRGRRFANYRRIWRLLAELRRHKVMKSRKSFSLLQLSSTTWNQVRTKLTTSHSSKNQPVFLLVWWWRRYILCAEIQRHTTKWHSSQDVDERIIILSHIIWTKQFKKVLLDFKILSDSLKQIKQKRLAWKYMRIHVVIFWEKSCNIKRFNTLL